MTCPNCGNTNGDSANFCGWCGNELPAAADYQEPQSPAAEEISPWRGGEVALGVLILVIAMTIGKISVWPVTRLLIAFTVLGITLVLPLHFLWLQVLGYLP